MEGTRGHFLTLREMEGGVFGKALYVIFVSNAWLEPQQKRVERGRQLQEPPPPPPAMNTLFLTLCMSQLLGDFVTQPVEESYCWSCIPCLLRKLNKNFSCIESSSPVWLPCLVTGRIENLRLLCISLRGLPVT